MNPQANQGTMNEPGWLCVDEFVKRSFLPKQLRCVLNGAFDGPSCSEAWQRMGMLSVLGLVLLAGMSGGAEAQHLRVDAGGGWAFPTNNLTLESEEPVVVADPDAGPQEISVAQNVDLNSGRHVYAGVGFVRSVGEKFELGVRLRAHQSNLRSSVNCNFNSDCTAPSGRLRAATIEGRIILTSPGWIQPYLLVGLGVVQTSVDGFTLRNVQDEIQAENGTIRFPEVSIIDAGGDVGIGASVPVVGGLALDAEVRVAGSLPGGKDNTVTVAPFTLGLAYTVQ